jgi:amino acid transporter/nucleotide-binding universal stress UspA family protein
MARDHRRTGQLGPLLCWAVVFADIGTSVYYTPGILYDHPGVGSLASAFLILVAIAGTLLAFKYAEISNRYAEGGGVVTVATHAFGPVVGCLGGMLITVDYFLTSSISSMSGIRYMESLLPLHGLALPIACIGVILLGLLNWVGIKESAIVTLGMAVAGLVTQLLVVGFTALQLTAADWAMMHTQISAAANLTLGQGLTGFAAAWLAFSGLETMSQLSAAMKEPRLRVARNTMWLVVASVLLTSPLLTAFSTTILELKAATPPRSDTFISELGAAMGGLPLKISVVIAASTLLLFAANTAILGCYHVFLALTRQGFMPEILAARSRRFGTPHIAITVATVVPIIVLLAARGNIDVLGDMYAFGLMGAFTLSSAGLDQVRWREGQRGWRFSVGLLTTCLVFVAFAVNLVTKSRATLFGGGVVLVGMTLALLVRRGVMRKLSPEIGFVSEEAAEAAGAEAPTARDLLTLAETMDLKPAYTSKTLVAVRGVNPRVLAEAAARAKGTGDNALYVLFVDEVPGLFYPPKTGPTPEAEETLHGCCAEVDRHGLEPVPIWRMAHDAGVSVAAAAATLQVTAVFVGTSQRGAVWRMLRGSVLKALIARLPESIRLTIVN